MWKRSLKKGDLKFTLDGFKLKGSWVLVRTGGYGRSSSGGRSEGDGRSWLLIKHRDDWAGPIDITTFAPLSVKTPDADLADILAADNPEVWSGNPPAKGGDTGTMFKRIIERALEIREENSAAASAAPKSSAPHDDAAKPAAKRRATTTSAAAKPAKPTAARSAAKPRKKR